MNSDHLIRAAAFDFVDRRTDHGEIPATWAVLSTFSFQGTRIPLVGQQGIFKPAVMSLPVSIRTTFRVEGEARPYDDEVDEEGYLLYRYRGTNQDHHENVWLRRCMTDTLPLLYFVGVARGLYMAHGAVIVEDHPEDLTFGVQLLEVEATTVGMAREPTADVMARLRYMAAVSRRIGQAAFRESVLNAYQSRCSLCRLGHRVLLDAAHIIPDSDGGASVVTNGISMCKIHHAAYDSDIIGIRPDHVAEVRSDVLTEVDGPMLRHGLQELHGATLHLPRSPINRPRKDWLERRYERFRSLR
jgi:putative restriction endonuclease